MMNDELCMMHEWTNPVEREYDALNDVDGGEDDDVDNIAEAFAQGELDKHGAEENGAGGVDAGAESESSSSTNLDKAWGAGWAASDEDMVGDGVKRGGPRGCVSPRDTRIRACAHVLESVNRHVYLSSKSSE